MTKNEIIEKAYGKSMEQLGLAHDLNGWIKSDILDYDDLNFKEKDVHFHTYSECSGTTKLLWRHSSLKGIENNNGWTEITKEYERMPDVDVWICNLKGNKVAYFHDALTKIPKKYTHFKIVERPKPPIY